MPIPHDNTAGTSLTSGTANLVVAGLVTGFRKLEDELANNEQVAYKAINASGVWEKGWGTWVSSIKTLTRPATVHQNSLGTTAKVSFTGLVTVFIVDDASMFLTAAERAKIAAIPAGGTTGQALVKSSGTDYVTAWATIGSGGAVSSVFGRVGPVLAARTDYASYYAVSRYNSKPSATTPILALSFGQSNPLGLQKAIVDFPFNARVKDLCSVNPATTLPSGSQYLKALNSTNFHLAPPDPTATLSADIDYLKPFIGYVGGHRGSQFYSFCNKIQLASNRDVIAVQVAMGGITISQLQAGGFMRARLDAVMAYVLSLPELAGVDYPDIAIYGQSEGNAIETATAYAANYLPPLDFKDVWVEDVYEYGLTTNWFGPTTRVYLTEPTQYVNWVGTPSGVSGDLEFDYPFKWEGINAIARHTSELITMVSSIGIPWVTALGSPSYPGDALYIHYTGDGNNQYGERIADLELGLLSAITPYSSELERELFPKAGGDIDMQGFGLLNLGSFSFPGTITGDLTITGNFAASGFDTDIFGLCLVGKPLSIVGALGLSAGEVNSATTNVAGAVGYTYDTVVDLTDAAAKHTSWKMHGTEIAYLSKVGNLHLSGEIDTNNFKSDYLGTGLSLFGGAVSIVGALGLSNGEVNSAVANTPGAIGYILDLVNDLTDANAMHTVWRNHTVELAYLSKAGHFHVDGNIDAASLTTAGSISAGGSGAGQGVSADYLTAFVEAAAGRFKVPSTGLGYLSAIADGAGVGGHKLATSTTYADNTASLIHVFNNTTKVLQINKDGYIENPVGGAVVIRPNGYDATFTNMRFEFGSAFNIGSLKYKGSGQWTLATSLAASSTGTCFVFNNDGNAIANSGILGAFSNNAVNKVIFNGVGAPGFWGVTPVTTQPTAGSGGGATPSTAGSGTGLFTTTKWNGGVGGVELSPNDIVFILKKAGLSVA